MYKLVTLLLASCHIQLTAQREQTHVKVVIFSNENISALNPFWKSTGFCPPLPHEEAEKWYLGEDMKQNIGFIGALPHSAIEQVRVHWLLDAVKLKRTSSDEETYDFQYLDSFIELLHLNGLRPGFEVMGNPGSRFTDFENSTQLNEFKSLIHDVAWRYLQRYGQEYISSWNFETWNEPSYHHFDGLNFTLAGFLNYYDVIREALDSASEAHTGGIRLRLGGPGGSCKAYDPHSFCWALLNHTAHARKGTNQLSQYRLDYISIHKKGEEPDNTAAMFDKEAQFYDDIIKYLPELKSTPIVNDEADPLVHWSGDKWWRADATYAAMIVKIIVAHQNKYHVARKSNESGLNFHLLSNDNGFLSYQPYPFTQRTLLARFQVNVTSPPHVQFIRKPAYSVMGMLSLLGETQLYASVSGSSTVGVLATRHMSATVNTSDSDSWSIIIFNSADSHNITSFDTVHIKVSGVNCTDCMYVLYQLDNTNGNPFALWVKAGRPPTPTPHLLQDMRRNEEPVRIEGPKLLPPEVDASFTLTLPLPGVALIHICRNPKQPPGQVTNVAVHNITGGQVLITWKNSVVNTKCIFTYEVEFAMGESPSSEYRRINTVETIYNSFVYMPGLPDTRVHGWYRVRAVNYWSQYGAFSKPQQYPVVSS